jgi:hypothetical protein
MLIFRSFSGCMGILSHVSQMWSNQIYPPWVIFSRIYPECDISMRRSFVSEFHRLLHVESFASYMSWHDNTDVESKFPHKFSFSILIYKAKQNKTSQPHLHAATTMSLHSQHIQISPIPVTLATDTHLRILFNQPNVRTVHCTLTRNGLLT